MNIDITLRNEKGAELTFNEGDANFENLKNAILTTLANSISTTEPANPVAGQYWLNTSVTPNVLNIRNLANDTWIPIGNITQSTNTFNVPVAQGGTGRAELTNNSVVVGAGTSAVNFIAPSTSGNVLTSNGTVWESQPSVAASIVYQPD
jgi:hypothetical protein